MKKHTWWLTATLSLAVAGVAFYVGRSLEPAPLIPPESQTDLVSAIATVEYQTLGEQVVFRADVTASGRVDIGPPTVPSTSVPLVTSLSVKAGDMVSAGELLAQVADRPVIVLPGEVTMFRDIRPQDTGSDVLQLQEALVSLGAEIEIDGVFGRETEQAVADLYEANSVRMLETGGQDEIEKLEDALVAARASGDRTQISRASSALKEFQATVGRMIPRGEIAFLADLPAWVLSLPQIGMAWNGAEDGAMLSVTSSELSLTGLVPVEYEDLVRVGAGGMAETPEGDLIEFTVTGIDTTPIVDEAGVRFSVSMTPSKQLTFSLSGANLRAIISTEAPDGAVLAVPLSAVYAGSDSDYVMRPDGTEVPVVLGYSANGWVEVVGSDLAEGDEVVVGLSS